MSPIKDKILFISKSTIKSNYYPNIIPLTSAWKNWTFSIFFKLDLMIIYLILKKFSKQIYMAKAIVSMDINPYFTTSKNVWANPKATNSVDF